MTVAQAVTVARDNQQTRSEIVGIHRSRVQSGDVAEVQRIRLQVAELQFEKRRRQVELRLPIAQGKVDYVVGTEYRWQQGLAGRGNSLGIYFETGLLVFNRNQGEIARARLEQVQVEARLRAVAAMIETEYSYRRGEAKLLEMLDAWRVDNEMMQAYNEAGAEFARSLYTSGAVTGSSTAQGFRP